MSELFSGNALWFSVPALLGTGVFVIRLALMLAGAGIDAEFDFDAPGDVDATEGDFLDADDSFRILSIQSIFTFLMGFGWTGLTGMFFLKFESYGLSLLLGCAGGAAMVWLLAILLKAMADLQSSGNVSIQSTLGLEGMVYATVPGRSAGRGQVQLVLEEKQRMYWAITEGADIPTKSRIRVTNVNPDNTVTVVAI